MASNSPTFGFSPRIEIDLEANGKKYIVAEVAPTYLVLRSPAALGPTEAVVIVTVDGEEVRRRVFLPAGLVPDSERQPLQLLETYVPKETAQAG
jgi:hypothetical protein